MEEPLPIPRPPREEQAYAEIGVTRFSSGTRLFLVAALLLLIVGMPLTQHFFISADFYQRLQGLGEETGKSVSTESLVTGEVLAVSDGPQTDGVYRDFVMKLHVRGIQPAADAAGTAAPAVPAEAVVAVQAMRDRVVLPVAAVRPGDKINFAWSPWEAVASKMESINTSELGDLALLSLPQIWGDEIQVEGSAEGKGQGRGPSDFFGVFAGADGSLPPEARVPVMEGVVTAWNQAEGGLLKSFLAANGHLAKRIGLFETALDDDNLLALAARRPVQEWMVHLGVGNEKAFVGREGWLFYEPGVRALAGPPFLDPVQLRRQSRGGDAFSAAPRPDPRLAIREFQEDLAKYGVELVLLPTPVKATIHPEKFTSRLEGYPEPVRNLSYPEFLGDIEQKDGVAVFDPGMLLKQRALELGPQYLKTDTHWRPEAMEATATALAVYLTKNFELPPSSSTPDVTQSEIRNMGDIGKMLDLPKNQTVVDSETVQIQALNPDPAWSKARASVLLLGDSFSNIYSLGGMGWGESAGFSEQLSRALGNPVKRLVRNDAGAHATREMLRDALVRDPDYLKEVKVVVWQFAERELAVGDWQQIPLPAPSDTPSPLAAGQPKPEANPKLENSALPNASTPEAAVEVLGQIATKAFSEGRPALEGADDWLFLSAELRHLSAGEYWGDAAASASQAQSHPDPGLALVDLKNKLEALGIELIVMPVPARAVIYPDRLVSGLPVLENGAPVRIDATEQEFYRQMREAGVNMLDLTDDFLNARSEDPEKGPIVCQQDTHWSPRGIELAVGRLKQEIGEPEWLTSAELLETFRMKPEKISMEGDLVGRVPGHEKTLTDVEITRISSTPDTFTPVPVSPDSPVVLLADSHGLVFHSGGDMHTEGAGLVDHLANQLGIPIDLMARRGSGASVRTDLARRFLENASIPETKKLVIYVFAARFLTESDSWKPVPLQR